MFRPDPYPTEIGHLTPSRHLFTLRPNVQPALFHIRTTLKENHYVSIHGPTLLSLCRQPSEQREKRGREREKEKESIITERKKSV